MKLYTGKLTFFLLIHVLAFCCQVNAQVPVMPVNHLYNRIENNRELNPFFYKLYNLVTSGKGNVNIVHIGDSHIQADFMSGIMRQKLQEVFGNGGRGLVFPYQLAMSNAPVDISSSSNITWEFNRLAHPEINIVPGVSGFVIKSSSKIANINFELKDVNGKNRPFKKINFFFDTCHTTSWLIRVPENPAPFLINNEEIDTSFRFRTVVLDSPASKFSMATLPSDSDKYFYGMTLENDSPGILYHTLGVNGARYEQFNMAPKFWDQLSSLKADLYIVSLGTNEAQKTDYTDSAFLNAVKIFINNLNKVSPGAQVLITTAPDTFKNRKPNKTVASINTALVSYCRQNNIPLWDLFLMNRGSGSCYVWNVKGLMNHDKIHFTSAGYKIFGEQLYHLFMKTYGDFSRTIPSKIEDR
jgi:lysophospholipase L1-like esterase